MTEMTDSQNALPITEARYQRIQNRMGQWDARAEAFLDIHRLAAEMCDAQGGAASLALALDETELGSIEMPQEIWGPIAAALIDYACAGMSRLETEICGSVDPHAEDIATHAN